MQQGPAPQTLKIKIERVPPFDGDYAIDADRPFNGRELHLIKQVAGVRLGEIEDALKANDSDLMIAIAAIAVWRADKVTKANVGDLVDMLLDAPNAKFTFSEDTGEADADPPAEAPNENASNGADNANSQPSSTDSASTSAETPETTLRSIGSLG